MATALKPASATAGAAKPESPPPLENGDRLTRVEFERRYNAMPDLKKAELIEGIVYMASPVRNSLHGRPHSDLNGWLYSYRIATPGTETSDNPTLRLDLENEVQPDALLRILPASGGRSADTADGYIAGRPELVAEISASSASYDLHQKKAVFRRHGVPEYLVWITGDAPEVRWFVLEEDDYVPLAPDGEGLLKSRAFPGLWLDPGAWHAADYARVHAILARGLASAEHAAFVRGLAAPTT